MATSNRAWSLLLLGACMFSVAQAGGQVLGAVLNRRTNYIPEFLYKLL